MLKNTQTFPEIPELIPFPVRTAGTDQPVILLDGEWDYFAVPAEIAAQKAAEEWGAYLSGNEITGVSADCPAAGTIHIPSSMDSLHVPGFTGYSLCRREVTLPEGLPENSRLALRFEAVNAHAAVFVNRRFVCAHENGLIAWAVDITDYVGDLSAAKSFSLAIALDDRAERVSTYSHGGIIHSVSLLFLPPVYLSALQIIAEPDERFSFGEMTVRVKANSAPTGYQLHLSLYDDTGALTTGSETDAILCKDSTLRLSGLPVSFWDAEHPRLYTLRLDILAGEEKTVLETVTQTTGFRKITRKGSRVFVNDREIKLRGACRHEVTAYNGRSTDRASIEADVRLFKEANINYVRTSHYPPTEYFLELCDRFGIYVEDELALAFVAKTLDYTQQDPAYTQRYLSHFSETYARDNHHPCVIIWSLCNESFGGVNFDLLNHFARAKDPTRLVKFSYPMTIREEYEPVDVWSIHYAEWNLDPSDLKDNVSVGGAYRHDLPVIHDEFVHVPCYNRDEHRRDPHVREFWGLSIAAFWDRIWHTEGALGGAIWAGVDETDIYVGGSTKLEWGIIDIFRRRKPEHYMTRKAYSPIRLYPEKATVHDGRLAIPSENRFCHTSFAEVKLHGWYLPAADCGMQSIEDCRKAAVKAVSSFCVKGPDITPFESGELLLPLSEKDGVDLLYLEFEDPEGNIVDEYLLGPEIFGKAAAVRTDIQAPEIPADTAVPQVTEDAGTWQYRCTSGKKSLHLCLDKTTGLILLLETDGKPALTGGPQLCAPKLALKPWRMTAFHAECSADGWLVTASGSCGGEIDVSFRYHICGTGLDIGMKIDAVRILMPHSRKLRVGTDCGGLDEYGFTLQAAEGEDTLSWSRSGDYTVYPKDFIGRNRGCARLVTGGLSATENAAAGKAWKDDTRHDMLNGIYDPGLKGSSDFTSLKGNIRTASLSSSVGTAACFTISPGTLSGICTQANTSAIQQAAGDAVPASGCGEYQHDQIQAAPLHIRAEALPCRNRFIPCTDSSLVYTGTWYDSRQMTERWSREEGSSVTCRFTGTGIVWYGPVDVNYGLARVSVDGIPHPLTINQRVDGVDFPGSAAGFDKKYHYPVFSVTDLPDGEHSLTVEVLGRHGRESADDYIVIESFFVIRPEDKPSVLLHCLRGYNFPQISWGNKKNAPLIMKEGDQMTVRID